MSKKIELKCIACSVYFKVYTYEVTARNRKFCSPQCKASSRRISIPNKEEIIDLYRNKKLSTNDLAAHYRVSKGTIYNWIKKLEVDTRTNGEGVSIAQTGIPHTEEHCQAISEGSMGKICLHLHGRRNHIFKNQGGCRTAKGGIREDLGIYVRSSWEANFARYLNFIKDRKIIYKWEFEPDTFIFKGITRGCISYTPDFKVWDKEDSEPYYYEVKGFMDDKSKTKLNRMKKYYPDIKIILFQGKEYKDLKKKLSRLIPNWE